MLVKVCLTRIAVWRLVIGPDLFEREAFGRRGRILREGGMEGRFWAVKHPGSCIVTRSY